MRESSFVRPADLQVKLVQKKVGGCHRIVICAHKNAGSLGKRSVETIRDALATRVDGIDLKLIRTPLAQSHSYLILMVISLPEDTPWTKAVWYKHTVRRVVNDQPKELLIA
ncbi:MAG: hypothetical protein WEC17_02695 [Candidatus Saccharimonadales bacterium]